MYDYLRELKSKDLITNQSVLASKLGVSRQRIGAVLAPDKQRARGILTVAVKKGIIAKPDQCSQCGKRRKLDAHHNDYSKPLNVLWLCKKCHTLIHKKQNQRLG